MRRAVPEHRAGSLQTLWGLGDTSWARWCPWGGTAWVPREGQGFEFWVLGDTS